METFISIILIIVGFLQICLFFKLWGMANNTIKIRDSINRDSFERNVIKEAQILALKGDYNNAIAKYNNAFYYRIIRLYEKLALLYGSNNESKLRDSEYQEEYKEIVSNYQKGSNKIGLELDTTKYDSFEKVNKIIARIY